MEFLPAAIYYFGGQAITGSAPSILDTAVSTVAAPVAVAFYYSDRTSGSEYLPAGAAAVSSAVLNSGDVTRAALAGGAVYVAGPKPGPGIGCSIQ